MKFVNVSWNLNELTLGQMWEVDLIKYESSINEILTVAQGEKGLEEFLKQVSLISYLVETK
jgi:dynein heavy chain 1